MTLSDFILSHREPIMQEWENFARTLLPDAKLDTGELRDHVSGLLAFIARDMATSQTRSEQSDKSRGLGVKEGGAADSAAEVHADTRFGEGFDIIQVASEFRALRASVIKLWNKESEGNKDELDDVNRFHEAIDQMQMEAISRYDNSVNHSRALFLGTLVHDMRNPLGAISNAVHLLKMPGLDEETRSKLADVIGRSNKTVASLVSDLIDATRARLGQVMPISPAAMNLGEAVRQVAREAEMSAHRGAVTVTTEGDLDGEWDGVRINQVLPNLLGNALQHGPKDSSVEIVAKGERGGIVLSVRNDGRPIPAADIPMIFDPLKRGKHEEQKESEASSLGLGLFITREILTAHGGKIEVTSTKEDGTMFTAWLPRRAEAVHAVQ